MFLFSSISDLRWLYAFPMSEAINIRNRWYSAGVYKCHQPESEEVVEGTGRSKLLSRGTPERSGIPGLSQVPVQRRTSYVGKLRDYCGI